AYRRETRQRWQHRNCPETRQVVANDRRPSVSKDSPPDNTGCEPCDREGEKRRPDSSTRDKRLDRRGSFQSPDSHGPLPQDKGPGIPVDTHVHRIFNRIGAVKTNTPDETERELTRIVDKKDWLPLNEVFVKFGQIICKPIGPKCPVCPLTDRCRWYHDNYRAKA